MIAYSLPTSCLSYIILHNLYCLVIACWVSSLAYRIWSSCLLIDYHFCYCLSTIGYCLLPGQAGAVATGSRTRLCRPCLVWGDLQRNMRELSHIHVYKYVVVICIYIYVYIIYIYICMTPSWDPKHILRIPVVVEHHVIISSYHHIGSYRHIVISSYRHIIISSYHYIIMTWYHHSMGQMITRYHDIATWTSGPHIIIST